MSVLGALSSASRFVIPVEDLLFARSTEYAQ